MSSQKSKTVVSLPLIISKARIQSVLNRSPNQSSNSDPNDGWITPTSEKRTIASPSTPTSRPQATKKAFVTQNRFSFFSDTIDATENNPEPEKMDQEPENLENSSAPTKPPPPIFIRVVNDYKAFCDNIKQLTKGSPFVCKSSITGIKLSTSSPDSYRSVIKFLQSNKAAFHTYQLKQDRAFRIVIRNLHHSTPIKEIEKELSALGHMPRNVTNVLHIVTKQPLPLFFVDLETDINNKDVFKIDHLYYTKIKIEEPRPNNQPIQCLRCQGFGHTKSYCNHPPKCVRCGDSNASESCVKPADQPATCALCSGDHPANYRGCPVFKKIQAVHHLKRSNPTHTNLKEVPSNVKFTNVNFTSNMNTQPKKSYAQATTTDLPSQDIPTKTSQNSDHLAHQMALFLKNFQSTINPLISLLTTLIEKLILSNDK